MFSQTRPDPAPRPQFHPEPLSRLPAGTAAIIVDLPWNKEDFQRMLELGFSPGVRIEVLQGGEAMILQLGGSKLAVSATLLDGISVVRES